MHGGSPPNPGNGREELWPPRALVSQVPKWERRGPGWREEQMELGGPQARVPVLAPPARETGKTPAWGVGPAAGSAAEWAWPSSHASSPHVSVPKAPVSRASGELSAAVQTPWRFCESDDISPYKHTHAHLHVKLSIKYEGVQGLPKPRLWTCELRCPASLQAGRRGLVLPWALQTQHLQKGCGNAQALKKVLLTP